MTLPPFERTTSQHVPHVRQDLVAVVLSSQLLHPLPEITGRKPQLRKERVLLDVALGERTVEVVHEGGAVKLHGIPSLVVCEVKLATATDSLTAGESRRRRSPAREPTRLMPSPSSTTTPDSAMGALQPRLRRVLAVHGRHVRPFVGPRAPEPELPRVPHVRVVSWLADEVVEAA